MRRILFALLLLLLSSPAFAQQDYVPRFDAFAGFSYLNSPNLNLAERGFNIEAGANLKSWLALGGDYSYFTGHSALRPQDLTAALQAQLVPFLPLLGPNPQLQFDSITYTFTAGPQFNYRKFRRVTLFARPAIGGMHQLATLKPANALQALVVQQLVPGGKKSDLQPFYGVGGGFDLNATKHFGVRVAFDYVHVNLFEGLLAESRNSLRISVGPRFGFGPNAK